MELGSILDAMVGALVGVLGVWLALGRGHWFLRFLAVAPLLLGPVLIPAYEMVYHHSIGVALIVLAIALYRQWRPWRWRYSSRTILLAMVVLAICAAVFANSPEFHISQWLSFLGIGIAIAFGTLLCLWTVRATGSRLRRITIFFTALLMIIVCGYAIYVLHYHLFLSRNRTGETLQSLWDGRFFQWYYTPEWLSWWFNYNAITAILAAFLVLVLLLLARGSGWISLLGESGKVLPTNRFNLLYRLGFVTLLFSLAILPTYVFYRLMTPEPYPIADEGSRGEFDEFVAIGRELNSKYEGQFRTLLTASPAEVTLLLEEMSPLLDRAARFSEKPELNFAQYSSPQNESGEDDLTYNVLWWFLYEHLCAERFGTIEERIETLGPCLRFARLLNEQEGARLGYYNTSETIAARSINDMMSILDESQCRVLSEKLLAFDRQRLPLADRIRYQRLWDSNAGWQFHLKLLLADLPGVEPYEAEIANYYSTVRQLRTVILQLVLQRYYLEHNAIPGTLAELVPEYLSTIPEDPFCEKPLQYRRLWSGFVLSSCCEVEPKKVILATGPAGPYMWEQIKKYSGHAWIWLRAAIPAPR